MKKNTRAWIAMAAAIGLVACNPAVQGRAEGEAPTAGTAAAQRPAPVTDGHQQVRDAQGLLDMEGDMKNGQREGVWTSYFPNGKVRSRNDYRNGRLEGVSTVFRENGALYYTGQHRGGKEVGEWRFYDEQGNLERTVAYDTSGARIDDPGRGR